MNVQEAISQAERQAEQAIMTALQMRARQAMVRDLVALRSIGWIGGEVADRISVEMLGAPVGEVTMTLDVPIQVRLSEPATKSKEAPRPNQASAGEPGRRKGSTANKEYKRRYDYSEGRTCPVCGVEISNKSSGCRKHWIQVKREGA